ncbi:MAG: hypothetical protein ACE5JB_12305 [bacterium]
MASEPTIKQQIEQAVGGKFSDWKIGATVNPKRRKAQLGNPLSWLHWKADSPRTARNIERYFLQKGMKRAGGAPKGADYIYILLVHNPH